VGCRGWSLRTQGREAGGKEKTTSGEVSGANDVAEDQLTLKYWAGCVDCHAQSSVGEEVLPKMGNGHPRLT
jgi:hypothetical protein